MLQKCNLWNVATVFFDDPNKKFELLEISRKINLAHTSVKKHLLMLVDLKIIKKDFANFGNKKNPCYFADKRNLEFLHYKKLFNIEIIKKSNIIDHLVEECHPNSIVLFGSFAKGEDSKESDIDLFVESNPIEININKFENKLNRRIQLHFKEKFTKYPLELKNNIINGNILYGYLEVYL